MREPLCGCPSSQPRMQNIENNPMQSRDGLNLQHFSAPQARSGAPLTAEYERAILEHIIDPHEEDGHWIR